MTSRAFRDRLLRRLAKAGALAPPPDALERIERYVQLLARWNAKINLTALPLDPPTDEALDRLLVEPIAAARHLAALTASSAEGSDPTSEVSWVDVGSGGGSPAVPLRIAGLDAPLTMVESKVRKTAFLREVVRTLELPRATVENDRVEAIAAKQPGSAQLITVRAVRLDTRFLAVARQLLRSRGSLALFCQAPFRAAPAGFEHVNTVRLIEGQTSYLALFAHVCAVNSSA